METIKELMKNAAEAGDDELFEKLRQISAKFRALQSELHSLREENLRMKTRLSEEGKKCVEIEKYESAYPRARMNLHSYW